MRILFLLLMSGILSSCYSTKSVRQQEDDQTPGQRFSITKRVAPKKNDHIYKEHLYKEHQEYSQQELNEEPPRKLQKASQDGAPSGPLPSFFQKVIPKREPISRYGNPDSYQVMGIKYDVMTNSTGYKSRGIASWYGTKFHKVRTSSGEKYDMYAMTAAHKTLPLPTYVRVRNLSNGKVAIVKVNDRGPFHDSRILDLSYAAAAKLGLFPKGTAPVEIEALKTTQRDLHYYVQAGAFESVKLAETLRDKLGKVTTSPVYIQKIQQRYLVQVGPFASKDMVTELKQRLERNDIHGSFSLLM